MSHIRASGWVVPLALICAGVVLLLNTLGVVAWTVWSDIGRYWPVLVILFALGLLWRNIRDR